MIQSVKYPVGIQDFEKLRTENYLYVDKTTVLYGLVNTYNYVFLSRPRRFGKSLMLSTLKAYFEGKKELFEGLAIENLEKDWKKYPVLLLQLSRVDTSNQDSLEKLLDQQFRQWEEIYDIKKTSSDLSSRFADIIIRAHKVTGERVVVLVDEYDNALINTLKNPELHNRHQTLLKSIYSNFKDLDAHIKFGMLTGVTRFSKLTIFSGLNNLMDITLDHPYAAICGITEAELLENFQTGIEQMADYKGWTGDQTIAELKKKYDGYHFTQNSPDIYNPFSILNAMAKKELGNYWFSTGIPSFLVDRMKEGDTDLAKFMNRQVDELVLKEIDSARNSTLATLFQAGFLTIKDYDEEWEQYTLGIPNEEVCHGMSALFMEYFLYPDRSEGQSYIISLLKAAKAGEPEEFLQTLQKFLSGVPFDLSKGNKEVYFHNAFYIISSLIGLKTKAECHTSTGSIDLLIENDRFVYIIELKLDRSAREALRQIEEKKYAGPFEGQDRKIFKIGVNFSSEERNITEWLIGE